MGVKKRGSNSTKVMTRKELKEKLEKTGFQTKGRKKKNNVTNTIGNLIARLKQLKTGDGWKKKGVLHPKATSQSWCKKSGVRYHVLLLLKDILKKNKKRLTQPEQRDFVVRFLQKKNKQYTLAQDLGARAGTMKDLLKPYSKRVVPRAPRYHCTKRGCNFFSTSKTERDTHRISCRAKKTRNEKHKMQICSECKKQFPDVVALNFHKQKCKAVQSRNGTDEHFIHKKKKHSEKDLKSLSDKELLIHAEAWGVKIDAKWLRKTKSGKPLRVLKRTIIGNILKLYKISSASGKKAKKTRRLIARTPFMRTCQALDAIISEI